MDLETQNQLLDTTCEMLLSFFDTEIKIDNDNLDDQQNFADLNDNSSQPNAFFKDDETKQQDFEINGDHNLFDSNFSPNQKILKKYQSIIEKKNSIL